MSLNKLKNQNILFFTRGMGVGGTEKVILQLCKIFKPLVNKIVVCAMPGQNVASLNKMNIKYYTIPDIQSISPLILYKVSKTLNKIIKDENITIIHTHHRMAAFYISILSLYNKCIFINTSHNLFFDKIFCTKFAYKHANLVACGNAVKNNLKDIFKFTDVVTINNSIDCFNNVIINDPLIDNLRKNKNFIIGNIGRLSKQKGFEFFIKAIPRVIYKYPNAKFVIIGSGEEETKLKQLVFKLKIQNSVFFLGYRNDIQNLISQLDLVVLSSLWEGFPLTPIETFSVKKTLIATDVNGTSEIVKNNFNGILIQAKSSEQISDKIIWMIEHPLEKKTMECNALFSYINNYSMSEFVKKYIIFYVKAVKIYEETHSKFK